MGAISSEGAQLTIAQRLAKWTILFIKAMWVVDVYEKQQKAKLALGEDAYKRIFHDIKTMDAKRQSELNDKVVTTIINGEVVGRPLKPGDGQVTVSPALCVHPTSHMKRRGNKTKWWTCTQCQSRWERLAMGDLTPEGVPTRTELRLQGQHQGMTFAQIFEEEKGYCRWVLLTVEQGEETHNQSLLRLAAYIQRREAEESGGWLDTPIMDSDLDVI